MGKESSQSDSIDLSFGMESSVSLWNHIFEGFDQEVVLVSKFVGKDPGSVDRLYKFGSILSKKYKGCKIEVKDRGIVIKKLLPTNDLSVVHQWTDLMKSIRREIAGFTPD